jgi:hypothetical protein
MRHIVKIPDSIDVEPQVLLDASNVPDLDASKIASGVFPLERLPGEVATNEEVDQAIAQHLLDGGHIPESGLSDADIADNAAIAWSKIAHPGSHRCRLTHSMNQAVSSGITTALTFDTEEFDSGLHNSTAASRITFTEAGFYLIGASFTWSSGGTDVRSLLIRKNGATFISRSSTTGGNGVEATAFDYFGAGGYVEVMAFQAAGTSQTISANTSSLTTNFWATRIDL